MMRLPPKLAQIAVAATGLSVCTVNVSTTRGLSVPKMEKRIKYDNAYNSVINLDTCSLYESLHYSLGMNCLAW
jgi:hypothetical protein